jgi:hypothetical protein
MTPLINRSVSLRPTEFPGLFNFILAGYDIDHRDFIDQYEDLRIELRNVMKTYDKVKFGEVKWQSRYRYVSASFLVPLGLVLENPAKSVVDLISAWRTDWETAESFWRVVSCFRFMIHPQISFCY